MRVVWEDIVGQTTKKVRFDFESCSMDRFLNNKTQGYPAYSSTSGNYSPGPQIPWADNSNRSPSASLPLSADFSHQLRPNSLGFSTLQAEARNREPNSTGTRADNSWMYEHGQPPAPLVPHHEATTQRTAYPRDASPIMPETSQP